MSLIAAVMLPFSREIKDWSYDCQDYAADHIISGKEANSYEWDKGVSGLT